MINLTNITAVFPARYIQVKGIKYGQVTLRMFYKKNIKDCISVVSGRIQKGILCMTDEGKWDKLLATLLE